MASQVMTVTGLVDASDLGVTDAHSHVWIDPVVNGNPAAPILNQKEAILAEIHDYKAAGGGAIIDCQPLNCGRDANKLHDLSRASDVKIVACTGFHLRQYYANDNAPLWSMSAEAACDFFLDEIHNGLTETRDSEAIVYPGFIKIAAEATFEDSPQHLFEAAAAAAKATGYSIEMHTERGAAIEDFLAFFIEQGVSSEKLVFCHVDKRADFGVHREMAQAGVMMEYDTFYRPKYDPENNVWKLIPHMIEAGLGHRIALATDMAGGELWARIDGGPGLIAFFSQIKTRLESAGIQSAVIDQLMGSNIASRLVINT